MHLETIMMHYENWDFLNPVCHYRLLWRFLHAMEYLQSHKYMYFNDAIKTIKQLHSKD